MNISIIIPSWQRLKETKVLIHSLRESPYEFELICNDDVSDDEVIQYLSREADILIQHTRKRHLTKAWNDSAKIAQGDYIFFVNNDLIISPNWHLLAQALEDNPHALMSAPQLVDDPKDVKALKTSQTASRAVSGCAMMCSKKLFEQVGYFDESMPFYFSDWDMNQRLHDNGTPPVVVKAVTAYHGEGERQGVWFERDQKTFFKKYPNGSIYSQ